MFLENNDDGAEKNRLSESIELFGAIQVNFALPDNSLVFGLIFILVQVITSY